MFNYQRKHIIFLVHGIGGNKTHFGHMIKALRKILSSKDSSTKFVIKNVEYETGHDEKSPYDFAKDLAEVINKYVDSPKLKQDDKISLIMHSQGGLIGSIWMFQSARSNPDYSSRKALDYIDAFITLGSPFWGAKTAKWGSEIKALTKRMGVKVPLPFGHRELEEMAFGSDMIFDFRQALIDPQYQENIQTLKKQVRFLNIIGVADILNPIGIFVSGVDKYEDDGAVPLCSARFNFLYQQSIKDHYADNDRTKLDECKEIDLAPYVVVNAMHLSPVPDMTNFPGIAQIPKLCVKDSDFYHPTFAYIWEHLLNKPITQKDKKLGDFKTVLIDINVRLDSSEGQLDDDLTIQFLQLDGSEIANSNVEISMAMELYSKGQRRSRKNPNHCRFYFTGHIKRRLDNRKEAILVKFSKPGYRTRLVEIELKSAYSTFIDINLVRQSAQ